MSRELPQLGYQKTTLSTSIEVESIVTVHYFEYSSSYYFPGESHDFWEFLYVDKGEVLVSAAMTELSLRTGDIIFHAPMEFHTVRANGITAPNLVVVSFDCHSPAMDFFRGRVARVTETQHSAIARIVETARELFDLPVNNPGLKRLTKRAEGDAPFGAEQVLKNSLELLLIELIRHSAPSTHPATDTAFQRESDLDLYSRAIRLFEERWRESLSLDEVCAALLVGRSRLQKLFHEKTGSGVMESFSRVKMEHAKRIIREGKRNFTEIAEYLGFSSLYYFSRQFKNITGMTPTEYSRSIQVKT